MYERLSISLIYDGTIPLQYLKNSSCFEVSTLPEIGNQYMFLKWVALMWERGVKSKQRRMNLFCSVRSFFFRFLLSRGNLDVQLESKWGWIKALHGNLYNVDPVCQTQLVLGKIIPVCISLILLVQTKSVSCARHESVEKLTLKPGWHLWSRPCSLR